jgi:hypothetical protein
MHFAAGIAWGEGSKSSMRKPNVTDKRICVCIFVHCIIANAAAHIAFWLAAGSSPARLADTPVASRAPSTGRQT